MSNRTLVELNHDYSPQNDAELLQWAKDMRSYMQNLDHHELPRGVKFKNLRHHSEPCPLESARASGVGECMQREKLERLVYSHIPIEVPANLASKASGFIVTALIEQGYITPPAASEKSE